MLIKCRSRWWIQKSLLSLEITTTLGAPASFERDVRNLCRSKRKVLFTRLIGGLETVRRIARVLELMGERVKVEYPESMLRVLR